MPKDHLIHTKNGKSLHRIFNHLKNEFLLYSLHCFKRNLEKFLHITKMRNRKKREVKEEKMGRKENKEKEGIIKCKKLRLRNMSNLNVLKDMLCEFIFTPSVNISVEI